MKRKRILPLSAIVAALILNGNALFAQGYNGGFGGYGYLNAAQLQQSMMDNIRDQLNFTNDIDWRAVQPLVWKVLDARRDVGGGGMRRMVRSRRNNPFNQSSPEEVALQNALDINAPAMEIKELLAKCKAAQQARQAKLEAAQAELRAVLTVKQEAQATLLGLLN